jgi:hypothetical protein
MRARARRLAARPQGEVTFLEASEAKERDLDRPGVILVGTPRANPWIARIAGKLPLPVDEKGIRLRGKFYDGPRDSLQLLYPSPFPPRAPLWLFTGNSDEAVLEALEHRRRGDYQIRREGRILVLGRFRDDWSLDPAELRDLESAGEPSSEEFFRVADETEERITQLLGPLPPLPALEVRLYPTLEHKGLLTDDTRPAHFEGSLLHAVVGAGTEPERLLAERLLEARIPDPLLRRGLAAWLASTEGERDAFDRASFRLARLEAPPRLASLAAESPFVLEAMSASFARFLLRERGPSSLSATLREVSELESRWRESLEADEPPPLAPLGFQRGFTLAHEGFEIHDGYLSARADRSLEKLQSLGVDSVAIVPYAFMSEPSRMAALSVPKRAGSETDEAVIHAIEAAKARGLTVLLKPQIWLRRSWPGEIEARGPEDEEKFFREYGRWLRHYAMMAEENGVDLLSIGTELSKMTRGAHTARWEALIRDVRELYRGRLVYAANWGEEVERVGFWPLLDYIGVDFYYPLSSEDSPSDPALREGFERSLELLRALSRRLGKPVLLTEIGYASSRSPWKSPHSSDGSLEISPEDQARAYEAAFEALVDETSWIRGIYWWKWPTDLSLGGAGDPGFTPNGKPAEEVVRRWYRSRLESAGNPMGGRPEAPTPP